MTLRVAFWWSLIFVSFVFVGAVKSRPVRDDICRIIKRGDCECQCYEASTTIWGSLADLYKRLFVRSFARSVDLEVECSKCTAECKRHIKANCLNGNCAGNDCGCSACWKGKSCDQPANDHSPKFEEDSYRVQISAHAEPGSVVATPKATDEDSNKCTKGTACPCGDIVYSITSGNDAKLFGIDKQTGEVRVLKNLESHNGASFEMTVTAQNRDGKQKAAVDVLLTIIKIRERRSTEHHIVRRSRNHHDQASPSGIIVAAPIIINNTFYKPGDKIMFNLTASHNQTVANALPTDNVNFKCSSSFLSATSNLLSPSLSLASNTYTNGELLFTLAAFPKVAVLKGQFEATVKANMHPLANLYFSCEATGTTSGVSYKIGPVSSTPPAYGVFPKVTFTRLTSPAVSIFDVDTTLHYRMTIDMPKLDFPLLVELTSAINDFPFMAVFDAKVISTGSNINIGPGGIKNPAPKYHKSTSDQTFYDRATLDFKNLTVSAESDVNNKIVIEWKVNVTDHPLVANGSKYWNGAGLSSGSNMLHVAQQAFFANKIEPALTCTITPKNNTVINRFSIDDVLIFDTECSHTNTSTANAKNVVLKYYSTYLDFLSSSFVWASIPLNTSNYNATMLNNITVYTFNQGQKIIGTLSMKVKQNMNPLVELNLFVKLSYKNVALKDKMSTIHKPKPPAIAAVPVFSLNIVNKLICYKVGSIIDLEYKILLRKIHTPLRVEIIAPTNASSPIIAIAEVSSPVVGSNILNSASLSSKPISCKSTVGDTLNDRCTIDFGDVTSIVGITNVPANEISIKFKILLNDHPIINNGSKYWPAVGVRGGSRMMWIGEVAANVCKTADPKPILKLEAICYDPRTGESCCNGKLKKNDEVQFNITISHDHQLSEQHADQVKIIHMLPPYVIFKGQFYKSPLLNYAAGPELTATKTLRFLDKLSFSYTATLDPEGKMPTGDIQATSIAEVTYVGHDSSTVLSRKIGVCCIYNNPEDPSAGKPSVESSPCPEWYSRGFMVIPTSKTFFVCSENVADISCFYTNDGGGSWNAADEQVGRIIGHVGETVYAISSNKRAYMKQVSRSDNWYAIPAEEWKAVAASAKVHLKPIPDGESNEADPAITLTDSDSNGYGGNKLGVYFKSAGAGSWSQKALWKCCGAI